MSSTLTFYGYAQGSLLYELPIDLSNDGLFGGTFVGLIFDYGVDEVVLVADAPNDVWGIDDIGFSVLGLDDLMAMASQKRMAIAMTMTQALDPMPLRFGTTA